MYYIKYTFIILMLFSGLIFSQSSKSTNNVILEMNKLESNGFTESAYNIAVAYLNENPDIKCDQSSMGLFINGVKLGLMLNKPIDLFFNNYRMLCPNKENKIVFNNFLKRMFRKLFFNQDRKIKEFVGLANIYLDISDELNEQVNIENDAESKLLKMIQNNKFSEAEEFVNNESNNNYDQYSFILTDTYIQNGKFNEAYRFVLNNKKSNKLNKLTRILAIHALKNNNYKMSEDLFLHVIDELTDYEKFYLIAVKSNLYSKDYVKLYIKEVLNDSDNSDNDFWDQLKKMYLKKLSPLQLTENIYKIENDEFRMERLCVANYFSGLFFLVNDNNNTAQKYFIDVISSGLNDLVEYELARVEIKKGNDINKKLSNEKNTIAILDFDSNGFTQSESKVAADFLTSMLIDRDAFRVLERAKMEEILIEQGFQMSGCFSNECLVEAGQLLGVQLMLAGNIGRFGNLNTIQLRVIDVQTSEILRSTRYTIEGQKELLIKHGLASSLDQLLN